MKSAAVLLTLFASAAAFVPATPRALARTAAPVREPVTQLNAVEVEDDVESKIARIGVVGGLGFPILAAPFAGGWHFMQECEHIALFRCLRGAYVALTLTSGRATRNAHCRGEIAESDYYACTFYIFFFLARTVFMLMFSFPPSFLLQNPSALRAAL